MEHPVVESLSSKSEIVKTFANSSNNSIQATPNSDNNIVRRSKSVIIHCNTDESSGGSYRKNPVIQCNIKEPTFPVPEPHQTVKFVQFSNNQESQNIKENLDDIKLEIEKLILEREKIIRENTILQFYKVMLKF